jgi:pyruvate, orthophosphate dikinase
VYFFGGGKADGNGKHEGCAGRQGRRPGRDDQRRIARASRIHHPDRGLSRVHARRAQPEVNVEMYAALERLEKLQGQKLGTGDNPLLVSVRSGAKFSMPGMMDTILNLGLNDQAVEALAKRQQQSPFCLRLLSPPDPDVRRRRARHPKKKFEHIFDGVKKRAKVKFDYELSPRRSKRSSPSTRSW